MPMLPSSVPFPYPTARTQHDRTCHTITHTPSLPQYSFNGFQCKNVPRVIQPHTEKPEDQHIQFLLLCDSFQPQHQTTSRKDHDIQQAEKQVYPFIIFRIPSGDGQLFFDIHVTSLLFFFKRNCYKRAVI